MYLLLKVAQQNKPLDVLLREGLTYKIIGELTELAIKEDLLHLINDEIKLTKLGEDKLVELAQLFKKRNKEEWIEKDKKNQIPKIDIDDIFLPSKDNLSF